MKKSIISFVIGVMLASVSVATAAQTGVIRLHGNQKTTYAGITCKAAPSPSPVMLCMKSNGTGYMFGVSTKVVMAFDEDQRTVFAKAQP